MNEYEITYDKLSDLITSLIDTLKSDNRIVAFENAKKTVLSNNKIITAANKMRNLSIYSDEYKSIKKELFQDTDFAAFKHYENEINLLILEINEVLKELTDKRRCHHENN